MKKVFALVLVLAMALLCIGVAVAEAPTTGSITVEKNYKGQSYTLYKLFDAQVTWNDDGTVKAINYVLPTGKNADNLKYTVGETTKQWFKLNSNGFIEVNSEDVTTDWAKDPDARAWAKSFGSLVEPAKEAASDDDPDVKWTGLDFGYYLVDSTMGAYVSVDTTNPNQLIHDKNNPPTVDKDITSIANDNGTIDDGGDNAVAQVGDTINYTLTVHAKPGAESYVVEDELSAGLTPPEAEAVFVTGLTAERDYTVAVSGQKITVTFTEAYLNTITANQEITITYPAVLNSNAVIGAEGNPNTVKMTWGHDPANETLPKTVKVYTAKISVIKHDGNSNGLADAKFALKNSAGKYYKLTGGTVSWVASVDDATKFTSDATGALDGDFTGLTNGSYTLEETDVPFGYNSIAATDPSLQFTIDGGDYTDGNLIQSTTVINNAGAVLPSTGGIGTTIFYVVGGLLVIGAAVILIARRKVNE